MRIPFIGKLFEKDNDKPKAGLPKSVHHNAKEIAASLKKYADANTLIEGEIALDAKNIKRFTTGILNVDPKDQTIIFDSFNPSEMDGALSPGCTVKFVLSHLGVRTQFECVYKSSNDSPSVEHLFSFPKGLEHIQLRDAFRMHISTVNPVRVTIEHKEKGGHSGCVSDLSVTGARVQIKQLIQPQPHRGDFYDQCYIILSDGQRIFCNAQLMHWQYDPKKDVTVLGLKFVNMEPAAERKLNRFLTDLQRKERNPNA